MQAHLESRRIEAQRNGTHRPGRVPDGIGLFSTLLIALFLAARPLDLPARESGSPRDTAREAPVVAELRALSPDAVPDFQMATTALDTRDYRTAAAAYRRVLAKAPDFDAALRRLGMCLLKTGAAWERTTTPPSGLP